MRQIFLVIALIMCSLANYAQEGNIKLSPPTKQGGMPLMQALNERQTIRDYTNEALTMQQISDLLWSAVGVNRPQSDNRRSSPTARNAQEIEVYVFIESGVYFYDAVKHELVLLKAGDHRTDAVKQEFAQKAPFVMVFVANYDKFGERGDAESNALYGATDAGFASQNVYLYCASEGLGTVVLGMIDREKIAETISLKNGKAVLGQVVGKVKK
ncbi:MAG: SagB/ThcOx family dehydrogenase [Lentimicrobiaceae bacterium]|nr:SagB/ThcOx family dehydrogenase [Lentimicrobiaceae bacterium]